MILIILIIIILYLVTVSPRKEGFDDAELDFSNYTEVDSIELTNDIMQELVLATNEYISKDTDLCFYIIETVFVKKYIHKESKQVAYKCMFMAVKHGGFPYGFSVVSEILDINGNLTVYGVRSTDIEQSKPYSGDEPGVKFVNYDEVRKSELDSIKKYFI